MIKYTVNNTQPTLDKAILEFGIVSATNKLMVVHLVSAGRNKKWGKMQKDISAIF